MYAQRSFVSRLVIGSLLAALVVGCGSPDEESAGETTGAATGAATVAKNPAITEAQLVANDWFYVGGRFSDVRTDLGITFKPNHDFSGSPLKGKSVRGTWSLADGKLHVEIVGGKKGGIDYVAKVADERLTLEAKDGNGTAYSKTAPSLDLACGSADDC